MRLFGLGGAVVSHKLFDNGTGTATIAGGGGTMWTTVLQIGELVDTAQKVSYRFGSLSPVLRHWRSMRSEVVEVG